MRKAIIGVAAVGAVVGLAVVGRRVGHKMREHCGQMAKQCKQMMAGQFGEPGEATEEREHCGQRAAAHVRNHAEAGGAQEHSEQETPAFVREGEAVAAA
jgi:hypothetical protein